MDGPVVNAIRIGLIYIFIITVTVLLQCFANYIMYELAKYMWKVCLPFKSTVIAVTLLYIVFLTILIDILIWTLVIMSAGMFTDFLDAFSFVTDNFTTLGGDDPLREPWEYVGPVMSINGIVIIAFAGAAMYDALYKSRDTQEII